MSFLGKDWIRLLYLYDFQNVQMKPQNVENILKIRTFSRDIKVGVYQRCRGLVCVLRCMVCMF